MDEKPVTAIDLRNAIIELSVRSAIFAHGRGMPEVRGNLRCAISAATELVKAPIDATPAPEFPAELFTDPERLFTRFVEAGGDLAVLEAAIRRVSRSNPREPGAAQLDLSS